MLDAGTLVAGRYAIISPLASGGSGLVYSATDRTTDRRVAIKILGPHVLHERAAREKLRLEAIVAGRVESENIVQVSDAGVDTATGYPFLVMELLKGSDLQHWVEQQGPLDAATAVELLRQVASGLDKSHSWKDEEQRTVPIVHRDLKPENLFLTHREDGTPLVKILDFGLAKVLSGSATMSSEVRGTPLYMAPEQLSQGPVAPATDIWALGLIAFFLLTGKCYWKSGQNCNAVLPAVLKEVADGPTEAPSDRLKQFGSEPQFTEEFDEWFLRCVNVDPSMRFQSAGEAVRALGSALGLPQRSTPTAALGLLSTPHWGKPEPRHSAPPVHEAPPVRHRTGPRKLYWVMALLALGGLLTVLARPRSAPVQAALTSSATSAENPSGSALVGHRTARSPLPPPEAPTVSNPPSQGKPEIVGSETPATSSVATQKISGVKYTGNRSSNGQGLGTRSAPATRSTQPPPDASSLAAPATSTPPVPRVVRDPAGHR